MPSTTHDARPRLERRAFSLLELITVLAIVGLLAGAAAMRFGEQTLAATDGEGLARRAVLALQLARRQAISEGTPAAVLLNRTGPDVTSLSVVRAEAGGDTPSDSELLVPNGVSVAAADDRWEFDFTGTLTTPAAGGTVQVTDGVRTWNLTVSPLTGHVGVIVTP